MNIGLIDVDSHNFPNLALMKLSAYHKSKGDTVTWWNGFLHYDIVYKAKVFDETYTPDEPHSIFADKVICGGTGYNLTDTLPEEVEHCYPDYSLYNITDTAYGFLTRGCPRNCGFCLVSKKEGRCTKAASELSEFWTGQKFIKLLDPNITAYKDRDKLFQQLIDSKVYVDFTQGLDARLLDDAACQLIRQIKLKEIHFAWDSIEDEKEVLSGLDLYKKYARMKPHGAYGCVYVLCNYNSTLEEDLYRVNSLRSLGYDPYVMIYDKPNAPQQVRYLQRWCNNKRIFKKQPDFYQFDPKIG